MTKAIFGAAFPNVSSDVAVLIDGIAGGINEDTR
jgi:hypothetical protein